jgi:hypothetical protein
MHASTREARSPVRHLAQWRLLSLYGLALCTLLPAWGTLQMPALQGPWWSVGWASCLLASLILGSWLGPLLMAQAHQELGTRVVASGWVLYLVMLGFVLLDLMGRPHTPALDLSLMCILLMQPVWLLAGGFGSTYLGTLTNALALTFVTTLTGGPAAVSAVVGCAGFLGAFLILDCHTRKVAGYPGRIATPVYVALQQILVLVGPVVSLLVLSLWLWPPGPHQREPMTIGPEATPLVTPEYWASLVKLLTVVFMGLVVLAAINRYFGRGRRSRGSTAQHDVPGQPAPPARLRPHAARVAVRGAGRRYRIAQIYTRFLAKATLLGRRRRRDQTGLEFGAAHAWQPEALERLTGLFYEARYGPVEPPESAEAAASAAAAQVLESWKISRG